MFTEGLDEKALDWVKQGSATEQVAKRSPLAERRAPSLALDPPVLYDTGYLSPNKLPPLKFHSGLLGLRPSSNFELDEDDDESVASAQHDVDMDLSDSFEEEGSGSFGSDLFAKPNSVSCDDEVRSVCRRGPALENLKVEVGSRSHLAASVSCRQQQIGHLNSSDHLASKILTPPSAPPIMGNGNRFIPEDESYMVPNVESLEHHIMETRKDFQEVKSFLNSEVTSDGTKMEYNIRARSVSKERDPLSQYCQTSSVDKLTSYNASGQSAWQTFIAYDACFRLCLNAWARDCMEAPEFLRDECDVLRNAFGLQKYLLQPRGQIPNEGSVDDSIEGTSTKKEKKVIGKITVEVKKIRIIPRRKLRTAFSQRAIYMQVGAEYVRNVTTLLKTGINSLKAASLHVTSEESMSCFIHLKSSTVERQKDMAYSGCSQPGTGDSYVFYPESQADALLIEVLDSNKIVQGQTTIQISTLMETPQMDKVQWWPLHLEDNECIGKVQLFISCSNTSNEIRSIKSGPVVETTIYDLVVEAAMRALHFHPRNLHISGVWKWLLDEFADYYGVSDAYTKLRYLSFIMSVATPTRDCLELIYELLLPVIDARGKKILTRQENSLLLECEAQVGSLLATTFKNYKSLDELSPTGLGDDHDLHGPASEIAAPALVPAVQIYTLLHDILSPGAQGILRNYLQSSAAKRCRQHMIETDEFMSSNSDGITDPMTVSTAYLKMKSLCVSISCEIQADIKIHNQHILPSSIDLPNIAAAVYSSQLCKRLIAFLKVCPPSKPSQQVTDLLIATADFERDLESWNISSVHGGVVSRDLFNDYIMVWIQDMRLHLLELCKAEKVPWSGTLTHYSTSPFVENMYDQIRVALSEYEVVIKRWPQYLVNLETAVCDVERAIVKALEKQYNDILAPLRDSLPKILEKHVQKLTRRQSVSIYHVPDQLGTFLNTVKRMLDVLHGRVEDILRSWGTILTVVGDSRSVYGEQMNGIVVMLRKKYKIYVQAIVEKLVSNTQANRSTRLKRILEETKEADGEAEIRERMQLLCSQVTDSICDLHNAFSSRIFITICRAFWDKMGQVVLNFLESRKENRIWYKASEYALAILDDLFASQMQTLQGNSLQEKDLDPPRSVIEARSILC